MAHIQNLSENVYDGSAAGLIDEGSKLKAVHIDRGWFEIDDCEDLKVVERQLL